MRIVNTLGPDSTDSYAAALAIPGDTENKIVLHENFDDIIANLKNLKDEYLLIPAAYQSRQKDFGWRELAYEYWDRLEMEQVFHHPLKPMVLISNFDFHQNKAIIHPATTNLLNHYLKEQQLTMPVHYAGSKASAYERFVANKYRFTVISEDVLEEEHPYQIIKRFLPEMVWCLYKIKG